MRLKDNIYLFNSDKHSKTTSCHQTLVKRAIGSNKIYFLTTRELQEAINQGVQEIKELMLNKIQDEN
jgi:hypothetical protein